MEKTNKRKPTGYWQVKENVLEESKKYSSRGEFARGNTSAYESARKNGWLEDCDKYAGFLTEFEARSKASSKKRKWVNKSACHEAALKCASRSEFGKKYPGAYIQAKENGWLDEWFDNQRAPRTYERFMEIASSCKTKSEVKEKDESLYAKAIEEGWFNDCPSIPEHAYSPHKWTDEKRREAALQCKTRGEYCDRFNGAWKYDNKHGLLDRYTHFVKPIAEGRDPNAEDYVIYVYRDFENKVAYVGLTYEGRKAKRHKEHVNGRKEDDGSITYDVVAKYWERIGKPLPEPTYVMEGLHIDDVGYYEDWYAEHYKKAGWDILNIAPCGSLGGGKVKWNTYEVVAEKSKEYKTRSEFCHKCGQAARKAYHTYTNDGVLWIDTFYWLRNSHEVRSEAARKNRMGKKLSEEHKKHISEAMKKYHSKPF